MNYNSELNELQATARAVIETLQRVPGQKYHNMRIAVIGGLPRMVHAPHGRITSVSCAVLSG
jgi:hypothetical protein